MEHLFDGPRAAIDSFEATLVNAFSDVDCVDAIWVRETKALVPTPGPAGGRPKKYVRSVWLQLRSGGQRSVGTLQARAQELGVRALASDFALEIHTVVDDLPPAAITPSCIWRRKR